MKKIIVILLSLIMVLGLASCTPASDPSDEYPSMNKLSISSSYKGNKDGNFFTFTFNWKEAETFSAKFSHDYDLYWAIDDMGLYELCEPIEGYSTTCELYTLVPGEKQEFTINVDDKYDGLPSGHYKFVFTFDVSDNGGEPVTHTASVEFDL